ncbi:LVIVD repeat-containing protein [Nocardioides sp. T5]|uniref:LVIVD repeat-containing protein n=1 Tax=Nocardioides sp. T5 TaxID=3400182 RepID=UPI003A896275
MSRQPRRSRTTMRAAGVLVLAAALVPAAAYAADPREDLPPGYLPWSEASSNIELLDNDPRAGAFDSDVTGFNGIGFANSDLAFSGDNAIVGSFNGFQVYDLSDPTDPTLRTSFVCPGGQGDPSVYGDLLFISVEETRGRIDCGTQGAPGAVNAERFRGVRIFDISDIDNPVQLPGVQTCRGSHTHTIVSDPDDPANVYIYNSGTSGVRSPLELAGCENVNPNNPAPVTSGNPTQWRIDVIKVPLVAPETAAIVSQPRIFTDPATGAFNGLQNTTPGTLHPSGTPYSPLPNTNTCHDVTAFPARELVAGACQGNGILLDTEDPVNPVRLDAVSDPNFSYWHSASFNNDGTKVIFTDEWGGGTSARCRATDQPEWGADALFDLEGDQMEFASYYKMPAVQTTAENCVAHNSSLVPVPGRDILVQAWYQGGLSVIDFSDTANPVEIAYFDRGPISTPANPNGLNLGGLWSTYWYNGQVYGTEIARGFDTFGLTTSDMLSENELDAAREVQLEEFNAQHQEQIVWTPSFNVAGAYFDQAVRSGELAGATLAKVSKHLEKAEQLDGRGAASKAQLANAIRVLDDSGDQGELKQALKELREHL